MFYFLFSTFYVLYSMFYAPRCYPDAIILDFMFVFVPILVFNGH